MITTEKMLKLIEEEIKASKKKSKHINVKLQRTLDNNYKAFLKFKIEGDYLLTSSELEEEQLVQVNWNNDHIIVSGIKTEVSELHGTLSEDSTAFLRAMSLKLKNSFHIDPAFVIGPPGTGKTHIILRMIAEAINDGLKILITAPTNMAIENIFERLDFKKLGLTDGDVVLNIKTDNEYLKSIHPKDIIERKLSPIDTEIEILQDAKNHYHKEIRDTQADGTGLKDEVEKYQIKVDHKTREKIEILVKIKKRNQELERIDNEISSLEGSNSIVKSLAEVFMKKKLEQFAEEKVKVEKKLSQLQDICNSLEEELDIEEKKLKEKRDVYKSYHDNRYEFENNIKQINDRLQELNKEREELMSMNIYSNAKIVGATLYSAALNQNIQNAEYDLIICDEASMALVPTLYAASQALSSKPKCITTKFVDDKDFNDAQNSAVKMALNKNIIFVGDPMQLSPIATTYDMKRSIFDVYGVTDIFNGIEVANTAFLNINYRNHPDIVKLASDMFYGGLLKSGREHDGKSSMYIRQSNSHMVLFERSYVNYGNAEIILSQIKRALERGRRSIGVITPYRKQANLINEALEDFRIQYPDADMQAGTIHTFQGKEKGVIIFDITYAPDGSNIIPATYQGDINSESAKLLNVAMTRAEDFFILVGDVQGIRNIPQKNNILKDWANNIHNVYSQYKSA